MSTTRGDIVCPCGCARPVTPGRTYAAAGCYWKVAGSEKRQARARAAVGGPEELVHGCGATGPRESAAREHAEPTAHARGRG